MYIYCPLIDKPHLARSLDWLDARIRRRKARSLVETHARFYARLVSPRSAKARIVEVPGLRLARRTRGIDRDVVAILEKLTD